MRHRSNNLCVCKGPIPLQKGYPNQHEVQGSRSLHQILPLQSSPEWTKNMSTRNRNIHLKEKYLNKVKNEASKSLA